MFFAFQKAHFSLTGAAVDDVNTLRYGAIPYELTHPGTGCDLAGHCAKALAAGQPPTWVTPFTAMFMHGGILHLAGNMLFLWIFGTNVEDSMGRIRFLVFYVLGGLAAVALQVAVHPGDTAPMIGASGAIAGVLAGYLVLYPRARVLTLVVVLLFGTIVAVPALLFLLFWFAQQAVFGALDLTDPTGTAGGVAYFAHVGGFLFGLLLVRLFAVRVKSAG